MNPEPKDRKITSLNYPVEAVLISLQEDIGEHFGYFEKR
jgi:hypothetical protein